MKSTDTREACYARKSYQETDDGPLMPPSMDYTLKHMRRR